MDYNATTPMEPEVIQVITEALHEAWGNPSSNYIAGVTYLSFKSNQSKIKCFYEAFLLKTLGNVFQEPWPKRSSAGPDRMWLEWLEAKRRTLFSPQVEQR